MELIKPNTSINFIGNSKAAFYLSGILILASIFLLIWRGGPNLGVDFSGGILLQIRLENSGSTAEIRKALQEINLEKSNIQEFQEDGSPEYLINIRDSGEDLATVSNAVREVLTNKFAGVEIRRVEMVGPKVGKDLREKALLAIFYSILFMGVYISGRFEMKWLMSLVMAVSLSIVVYAAAAIGITMNWLIVIALISTLAVCGFFGLKYALGTIIALIHNVVIIIGFFALTDREISLSVIAALLTVVGYSINDNIVIFDRIRENIRRYPRRDSPEIFNTSLNETLSRTVITSLTTLFVLICLFIFGGSIIHDFAFAMMLGVIIGTYSSIFVASPVVLIWGSFMKGKTLKIDFSEKIPFKMG